MSQRYLYEQGNVTFLAITDINITLCLRYRVKIPGDWTTFFFILVAKHVPGHWETLFNLRIFGISQISLRQNPFIVQNRCNEKKYFTIFSSPKYDVVVSLLSETEKATSIDILSTCFKLSSHTKADIIHFDEKKKPQRVAQWFNFQFTIFRMYVKVHLSITRILWVCQPCHDNEMI